LKVADSLAVKAINLQFRDRRGWRDGRRSLTL